MRLPLMNHSGASEYLKAARALAPELPHGVHEVHEDVGHVPPDLALLGLLLAVRLLPALAEVMRCVSRKRNTVSIQSLLRTARCDVTEQGMGAY